jgi:hypothetical protein
MIRILKNRRALSTVITTLIILVVSILLASVVAYYATNVVSTRVQEESLHISKQHVWVNSDGDAEAALMVTNNGGRDVVINKVSVRGQTSDWGNVFYAIADPELDDLADDLAYLPVPVAADDNLGLTDTANLATTNLILPSGMTMVIYLNTPDSIGITDIGLTVGISLHSAQAVYYSETNIQAITVP